MASDEWLVAKKPSPFLPLLSRASEFRGQELDEVAATAGVAPLIVVPGQNFYAAVADNFGVFGIDDGGIGIALEVGGDEFLFSVTEDALHGAAGGGFQSGVDGFFCRRLVDENSEVHNADVGSGHAHGIAVELALQFGNDEVKSFGGAGGAGNHVDGGGTRAAEILVREVEEFLVIGVRVDGGHGAAVDAESFLENFGDGGEAIGGAGSVGNDVVRRRIVGLVVHAEDESGVGAIGRGGDDHFFHGSAEMLFGVNAFGEEAGGFDDDIGSDRSPIDFGGILGLENLEALAFDGNGVIGMRHVVGKISEDGIVLQKVRERVRVGDVVDGDELNVSIVERGAHDVATNAAEAVDANLNGHSSSDGVSENCGCAGASDGRG